MVTEAAAVTKWERALVRAQANGVQVRQIARTQVGYDVTTRYEATSVSRPGTIHRVAVHCTATGVEVVCGCEAGQRGQVCMHAAGVLKYAGLFAGSEPATVPQPVPILKPARPKIDGAAALRRLSETEDAYPMAAD